MLIFTIIIILPIFALSKLAFVYEISRHGARSPLVPDRPEKFPASPPGMLTPSGMRQKYLRGRWNRWKYVEKERLLAEEWEQAQVEAWSTDVDRTI